MRKTYEALEYKKIWVKAAVVLVVETRLDVTKPGVGAWLSSLA